MSVPASTKIARAFAPATVANVAVGFDILGFAIDGVGDTVIAEIQDERTVTLREISGTSTQPLKDPLPKDPMLNTATVGVLQMIDELGLDHGFKLSIQKGIPLGSGMGGSAASAVAGVVAANALLKKPLSKEELFRYALVGESIASGAAHGDNIAPCLFGGMTLVRAIQPADIVPIPVPESILCVLVHPQTRLDTRESRAILRPQMALSDHVKQSSNLAGFISGCYRADFDLIGRSLSDVLIEPQRARLIRGFPQAKKAAMDLGALGFSISGSGPSIFAWAKSPDQAKAIQDAVVRAIELTGVKADAWISPISPQGARVLE